MWHTSGLLSSIIALHFHLSFLPIKNEFVFTYFWHSSPIFPHHYSEFLLPKKVYYLVSHTLLLKISQLLTQCYFDIFYTHSTVFPVVMYRCESWTIKKAEHWRIDAFELRCWRRLLRVPWTAKRSNRSILKEISPEYSLEGLMLKLKLQ